MQVSHPTQIPNEQMPLNTYTSEFLPSIPTLILSSVSWMEDFLVTSSKLSASLPFSHLAAAQLYLKIFVQPSHFMQDIWITHWKLSWSLAYGNLNGPSAARPILLRQQSVTEAFAYCSNQPALTNIRMLLLIFAAIPVNSASSERAFSQLCLLKTYLYANMTEQCLCGLLTGLIHREQVMTINLESIFDVFSEKNRHLDFSC